jgi:hypothetical protein
MLVLAGTPGYRTEAVALGPAEQIGGQDLLN